MHLPDLSFQLRLLLSHQAPFDTASAWEFVAQAAAPQQVYHLLLEIVHQEVGHLHLLVQLVENVALHLEDHILLLR